MIVVANLTGVVKIDCGSASEMLQMMRDALGQPEEVVHELGLWSIHAKPGEWVDWPQGYLFVVSSDPVIVDDAPAKAQRH